LFNARIRLTFAPLRPFFPSRFQPPTRPPRAAQRQKPFLALANTTRALLNYSLCRRPIKARVDLFAAEVEQISPRSKKLNSNLFVSIVWAGNNSDNSEPTRNLSSINLCHKYFIIFTTWL
jgi:hypothetical protein